METEAGWLYCGECKITQKPHWHRILTLAGKPWIDWIHYTLGEDPNEG